MLHRRATLVLSALLVALGLGMVTRALIAGGGAGAVGVVVGVLFCAVGAGRAYLEVRR